MAKKRKKRRPEPEGTAAEPVAPVVTVSCPNCGGSVRADPGERTPCAYCGEELHLPLLAYESEPPPATPRPEPEALEPVKQSSPTAVGLLLLLGLLAIGAIFVAVARPAADPTSAPQEPLPTSDPEVDGMLEHGKCLTGCLDACIEIKDPDAMIACHDHCDRKCKYVGKGSSSACRARCRAKCEGMDDMGIRGACLSGCNDDCPP